jgi:transposase
MRAYSLDLRQKVITAVERGDSTIAEVAATFGVGLTFVKKMLRQHRETGDLSPRPYGGGQVPRPAAKHLKLLRAEVARRPDKTVVALRDHLEERAGLGVSTPTVSDDDPDRGGRYSVAFDAYLARMLGPRLRKGGVVVLDNLNVHKASRVEQVAASRRARVLRLSPYSPDFSPIEQCWSKIKTSLRAAKARTRAVLEKVLAHAINQITKADIRGWFKHCGYKVASVRTPL